MQDGTYSIAYDYNAENSGIVQEKGTFAIDGMGVITMTSEDGETVSTATAAMNEDGTITYTATVTESNTSIVCNPTGIYNAGASADHTQESAPAIDALPAPVANANGFVSAGLYQPDANGWLGCHVVLNEDGTFIVSYDFNAENSGILLLLCYVHCNYIIQQNRASCISCLTLCLFIGGVQQPLRGEESF